MRKSRLCAPESIVAPCRRSTLSRLAVGPAQCFRGAKRISWFDRTEAMEMHQTPGLEGARRGGVPSHVPQLARAT